MVTLAEAYPKIVRLIAPVLLDRCQSGDLVTYGELKSHVERSDGPVIFSTDYGWILGELNRDLQRARLPDRVPPVSAIVVAADTNIPSGGIRTFVERYLSAVGRRWPRTAHTERMMYWDMQKAILEYSRWPEFFRRAGLVGENDGRPIKRRGRVVDIEFGGGGESEDHRGLKEDAASRPSMFRMPKYSRPEFEYRLRSQDCVDLVLWAPGRICAVEVRGKNASDADVVKGVYQTLKYKALCEAELLVDADHRTVSAFLLVGRELPTDARVAAKRLAVNVKIARSGRL